MIAFLNWSAGDWVNAIGVVLIPVVGGLAKLFWGVIQAERRAREADREAFTKQMEALTEKLERVDSQSSERDAELSKKIDGVKEWADERFVDNTELQLIMSEFSVQLTKDVVAASSESVERLITSTSGTTESLVKAVMEHTSLMEHRMTVAEVRISTP